MFITSITTVFQNEGDISWKHIEELYLSETEKPEHLRYCPKLTKAHIWLSSYSKMKVNLAAQVHLHKHYNYKYNMHVHVATSVHTRMHPFTHTHTQHIEHSLHI